MSFFSSSFYFPALCIGEKWTNNKAGGRASEAGADEHIQTRYDSSVDGKNEQVTS